jgi:hypothetical protein
MQELIDSLAAIISIISSSDIGKAVTIIGLVLVVGGMVLAYFLINKPREEISVWHKIIVLCTLIPGILFLVGGPVLTLFWHSVAIERQRLTSASERFDHLIRNSRVNWLIRLILYDVASPDLAIDRFQTLGPKDQRFTFVADYDEVRGMTAAEAARNLGLATNLPSNKRISAIIFPREERQIIPVNARGLLQVINAIQKSSQTGRQFKIESQISQKGLEALSDRSIESWSWPQYKQYYSEYCTTADNFRCDDAEPHYSAKDYMGNLSRDWNPLGFSAKNHEANPCSPETIKTDCAVEDIDKKKRDLLGHDVFGARVFLIENEEIKSLDGRIMIDFDKPTEETIPFFAHNP